jgi:hypothetical protein
MAAHGFWCIDTGASCNHDYNLLQAATLAGRRCFPYDGTSSRRQITPAGP